MNESPILTDDDPTIHGGDPDSLGRIDHYDLLRKLGGGGFGVVYLARDSVSGVEVALKTLHPLLKHNAEEMDLLREKFRLVHGLTHPNIAKALVIHLVREINVWDDDARAELKLSPGDSVMVMDYAPGVTLSRWRCQFPGGIVPPDLALEIGRQVAAALDYAHSERIVHRDVKPGNIMVETLDGGRLRVRILDFGLAAEIRSSMSRVSTETGDTSGTRPYMAPEQWLGKKQDGRTDQYALACVLYELLSGAPPFAGVFETGDPAVMMATVEKHAPEPISGLPRRASGALLRALAKDPAARFPSCTAFVKALSTAAKRPSRTGLLAATLGLLVVSASLFAWLNRMSSKRVSVPLGDGVTLEMVSCPGIRPGYYMGKYEVTQEQWQRVMGNNPSNFKDEKKPVENVSWNDCQAFLEKLNALPDARNSGLVFFLPEESDWRAACRAGAPISSDYCKLGFWTLISAETLGRVARYGNNDGPIAVGSLEPNAWGLYDMHGNVWEWTKSSVGGDRVICGGSFDQKAHECTVGFQNRKEPRFRSGYLGVRLAATCWTAEHSAKPEARARTGDGEQAAQSEAAGWNESRKAGERKVVSVGGVDLALRWCPPGSFTMGSPADEDGHQTDETQHRVTLTTGFWLGETEVTQGLWKKVMSGNNPSNFKSGDDYPVENVSWNDCQEFIRKLNALPAVKESGQTFRLPTEEEWETACRAGAPKSENYCKLADGTQITQSNLSRVAWFGKTWEDGPTEVGKNREPNAWGLYDMHGNVWEWTQTADGDNRVYRGGSFDSSAVLCAAGFRAGFAPDDRDWRLGFRLAASGRTAAAPAKPEATARTSDGKQAARSAAASRSEKGFNGILNLGSGVSLEMVHCPGVVPDFWMGKYEVTQEQWKRVMGNNPSEFKGAKKPVESVSWNECQEFVEKLNALPAAKESGLTFRLPKEEEWETACRAGAPKSAAYCKLADGTQITRSNLSCVAWFGKTWEDGPTEVGKNREPNAWGLYDMPGNVWEWTETADGGNRVGCGGSFYYSAVSCAAGCRFRIGPGNRFGGLGFRLAASGRTATK